MWKGIIEKYFWNNFQFLILIFVANCKRTIYIWKICISGTQNVNTLWHMVLRIWRWIPSKSVLNLNRQTNDVAPLTRDVQFGGPYIDFIINKKLVPITLDNKAASNVKRVRGRRQFNMGIDVGRWMTKEEEGSRRYLCVCWSLFVIFVTSRLIVWKEIWG